MLVIIFRAQVIPAVLPINNQAANEIQNGAEVVDILHVVVMVFSVVIYRLHDPLYYSRKL